MQLHTALLIPRLRRPEIQRRCVLEQLGRAKDWSGWQEEKETSETYRIAIQPQEI